jgi:uncharacterized membrane protein
LAQKHSLNQIVNNLLSLKKLFDFNYLIKIYMKKIIIFLFVMLLSVSNVTVYAHEHHPAKDSMKMSRADMRADSLMQLEMAKHQEMEAINAFPNYHPLIVHFPIVLLLMALMFQLLSLFYLKKEFGWTTLILLTLGVITAWLASNTFHADPGLLKGRAAEIFATHEQMADLTWWFSLVALIGKIASHFFLQRKLWIESLVTLLLVGSGITVSIAGHHGAMLVHMEGIGPMGKYLDTYHPKQKVSDSVVAKSEPMEEDHHVGELGKGPHGGTIEEADPNHMEIVASGNDFVFYLLDGNAKPVEMKDVAGSVKIQYANKVVKNINLMEMGGKLTAMNVENGQSFTAICTLKEKDKSYIATFNSKKDLPSHK